MDELPKSMSNKAGLPPGTLAFVGRRKADVLRITRIEYNETSFAEAEITNLEECSVSRDESKVTWINVDGIHDKEVLARLGHCFGLHHLILEDILNTEQRPKMDDLGEYIFIVLKTLIYDRENDAIDFEQVSLVLGKDFVVSFQEEAGNIFDPVRERIRTARGRIRSAQADYLAHALMDAVIDNYFLLLEQIGEKVDLLEEELISNPAASTLQTIHYLKRQVLLLRRSVWPLREMVYRLERGDSPLIRDSTRIYFRDIYDHTIQVMDTIETLRDMLSGMLDVYLSSISNRMNEVMKVLTIIATLFIPATFIAGIYGMNFRWMPELEWRFGYPMVWIIVITVMLLMLVYFRVRKWL